MTGAKRICYLGRRLCLEFSGPLENPAGGSKDRTLQLRFTGLMNVSSAALSNPPPPVIPAGESSIGR